MRLHPSVQKYLRVAAPIAAILLSNGIIFFDYWTASRLFTGKDLLTAFGPLLNFQTDCLQQYSLPLWNPFLNFGYPFVEHYSNTMFFPTHLIMGLFTGSSMVLIQRELLFWMALAGIGAYLCCRELGRSQTVSIVTGIAYMCCGQILELPHWHLLVYNAACFPYLVFGYHRARSANRIYSLTATLFLAFSMLGGHITTTVLGCYLFAGYVLADAIIARRVAAGVKFLAVTFLLATLLSLPKLAPLFQAMHLGPRMLAPESLHTKDPFNVVNWYNFMSLLLPVKYYYSLSIGLLAIIAAVFGALRRTLKLNALIVLYILSAWLLMVDSDGTVSLLRSLANLLPVMKLVRNEWFEWFYPSLFALLYLSDAVEQFISAPFGKLHITAVGVVAALTIACFSAAFNAHEYTTALIVQLCLTLAFLALPLLRERATMQSAAALCMVTVECFLVFARVAPDLPPQRNAQNIQIAVIDQGSIGKSYQDDNRIRSGFYATPLHDEARPSISESTRRPILQSGLHGAPMINYAPEQYGLFIDDMNQKRFSGWWYNAQERFYFIRIKDSPMLAQMEGRPLYGLFDAVTGAPLDTPVFDHLSCSQFAFSANLDRPGHFILNQMYDDRWTVSLDGTEQRPVRADEFFMGVAVPPGRHRISFLFRDHYFTVGLIISIMTLFGLAAKSLMERRKAA